MIVVHKSHAHTAFFPADPHRLGHVFELAISLVAQQPDAVTQTNSEIGVTIIVEIAGRASEAAAGEMDARFLRHIVESSIAQIA